MNTLPKQNKYFTVVQYDDGPLVSFFEKLDIKIFAAGGKPDDAIPIPLVCDPHVCEIPDKDILMSFYGNFNTHELRQLMYECLKMNKEVVFGSGVNFKEYENIMARSLFALCPRGYGKTSFRLYEAIQLGTIPIYISNEHWIPFSDVLDWSQFAIIIRPNEMFNIDGIVNGIRNSEKLKEMQYNLKQVQHLFTYDGCFRAIDAWLSREKV